MAGRAYFCARFDIDTIFTPWRIANWVSLFGDAELSYLPRLLAQAKEFSCQVHFFALGFGVLHYPDLLKQVVESGFALDSHLHTHRVKLIDEYNSVYEELLTAEHLLCSIGAHLQGVGATGMYPKALDGREDVQGLLVERGYQWVSSRFNLEQTLEQLQPYRYANGLLELPCAGWSDMTFFYYYKDRPALPEYSVPEHTLPHLIAQVKTLISRAARQGLVYAIDLHPAVLAKHDPGMEFLPAVAEHARREGVELADLRTIAGQISA